MIALLRRVLDRLFQTHMETPEFREALNEWQTLGGGNG